MSFDPIVFTATDGASRLVVMARERWESEPLGRREYSSLSDDGRFVFFVEPTEAGVGSPLPCPGGPTTRPDAP